MVFLYKLTPYAYIFTSLSLFKIPFLGIYIGIVVGEKGEKGDRGSSGTTYVRWGKLTCPDTEGTELLYSGTAAASHHYEGGGGNYQCLTSEPANFAFGVQREDAGYIYGAEFETWGNVPQASLPLANQNVACAVCYISTRGAVVMIPGTYICPAGWTREYYGYLMSERHKNRRSTFECVDNSPDILPPPEGDEEREGDDEGALFYHVEPRCGSLACPPYEEQREITCVVCSR